MGLARRSGSVRDECVLEEAVLLAVAVLPRPGFAFVVSVLYRSATAMNLPLSISRRLSAHISTTLSRHTHHWLVFARPARGAIVCRKAQGFRDGRRTVRTDVAPWARGMPNQVVPSVEFRSGMHIYSTLGRCV